MLSNLTAIPALAVKDLAAAREFYENVLGFSPGSETVGGVLYQAGQSQFLVYPSAYAGTNKATALSFMASDESFDAEVAALRDKGIKFQTFEYEGTEWQDGVATMGDSKGVWFTDPDGNILSVATGMS
ncbi:VOC family protein [Georgenia sp. SYP-B2076]|uniref:VOC family protein n=1 Tax=Georgenia sp. SYP-B2076 TaxID=2495881 RepID=UPI000F8CA97B|nr:VOC family protein [Georgenia sp. SYP-B2076]